MIECDNELDPGTPVELDLAEAGILAAEVRWCLHGQLGLHFGEEFALGKLSRTPRKGSAPEMLKPEYLEPRKAAKWRRHRTRLFPAKAGAQSVPPRRWAPAFAGMRSATTNNKGRTRRGWAWSPSASAPPT